MRKSLLFLLALFLLVLPAGVSPTQAADPQCVMANVKPGPNGQVGEFCIFTADSNPHFYSVSSLNLVWIFKDANGNHKVDTGETVYKFVNPNDFTPVGQINIPTGTNVTVSVINGCAGSTGFCAWAGSVVVR